MLALESPQVGKKLLPENLILVSPMEEAKPAEMVVLMSWNLKLDCPKFFGENPEGWLFKVNHYF